MVTFMTADFLPADSFVLYKQRPARIIETGAKKLTIQIESGDRQSVRPKDVMLLHPGPLRSFGELHQNIHGDTKAAWELLAGEQTTLQDLSELAFDAFTPATAWAIWEMVEDGLYFRAEGPDAIDVRSEEDVIASEAERAAKAEEEAAWNEFAARMERGVFLPEDEAHLTDVVELALGQRSSSRTLSQLGRTETPQSAHQLLLDIDYWDETVNPYPSRFGLAIAPPAFELPTLPDESRRDLTHLPAFAIDDEGNTDPDDALSWDGERLWVHVADVAALVPPDSPAELEARARGANLYLPEGTAHMLPEAATAQLGLGLQARSPALSFGLLIDEAGAVVDTAITPSWVKVTRLSYEEAGDQLYEGPLNEMRNVLARCGRRRAENGAIELTFPEVKVRVDAGEVKLLTIDHTASRDLVREAMLVAGEAVARYALEHEIPLAFTVQDAPNVEDPASLQQSETLAEMYAVRRLLNPGRQVSKPDRHSGLGLDLYVQVTSPLRRYHDLLAHQQLRAYLRGDAPLDAETVMQRTSEAREMVRSVRVAERLSINHWLMVYLQRHPDWQGRAIVLDKRGARTIISIPDLAYETEVYGRNDFQPDDEVEVALSQVDLPAPAATFRFL
jgi:exoribonuclease-2